MSRQTLGLRGLLTAPGTLPRQSGKARSVDADAVILDLEDAVGVAVKRATRARLAAALGRPRRGLFSVRVNAIDPESRYGDRLVVVQAGPDGTIPPKAESAVGAATIIWLLSPLARDRNLGHGCVPLIPTIKTAPGRQEIVAILAAGPRARRIAGLPPAQRRGNGGAWLRAPSDRGGSSAWRHALNRRSDRSAPLSMRPTGRTATR